MSDRQLILILDFGSQYGQLIARRVRENHVFSQLVAPNISFEELKKLNPAGLILSGGPASVYESDAPQPDPQLFELGVPVLGICYGMQVACRLLGAEVNATSRREYGRARLNVIDPDALLRHLPTDTSVWMSHGDQVTELGGDFVALAATPTCPFAAIRHAQRPFYGVQFHPEVTHTPHGSQIIRNFLYQVCNCKGDWRMSDFAQTSIARVRESVGDDRVICGLSGGVDSSVVATLLHAAVGDQLACIFVDNGLLRKDERQHVEDTFRDHFSIELHIADAGEKFLRKLAGVTDPQKKRTIIGHEFIDVFKAEATHIKGARFLAQGTLYPDVIESGHSHAGTAANIKLHHNVGGLPEKLGFELIEPLRDLFKDEVRVLGENLGLPEDIVWRHPFPGPGLAVRIIGEITEPRLHILREADHILLEEIRAAGLYRRIAQCFAVLLPISSVGVMGDGRSYDNQSVVAIRAVESTDFMTADWVHMDPTVLAATANRIINEVRGVNRVVYDISSKPPATIEWE